MDCDKAMNNELSFRKLTELVCTASNISDAVNYFFDMVDEGGILEKSTFIKDVSHELKIVLSTVTEAVNRKLNTKAEITNSMLQYISSYQLTHGVCFLNCGLGTLTLIYLSEVKTAIVTMVRKETNEYWRINLSDKPFVKH